MKIAIAQIEPVKGSIEKNVKIHKKWVEKAIEKNVDFIYFPELSLTGYEPELSKKIATETSDSRLSEFQILSDKYSISIAVGLITKKENDSFISMIFFQPKKERVNYSKQFLHSDELVYFKEGSNHKIITIGGFKIAPAICYESMQKKHLKKSIEKGTEVYLTSVAKSEKGINKAYKYYQSIAREFGIPVLMCNSVGFFNDFESAGQSAVWNTSGDIVGKLPSNTQHLLIYNLLEDSIEVAEM